MLHPGWIALIVILGAAVLTYLVIVWVYVAKGPNDPWPCHPLSRSKAYLASKIKGVYGLTLRRNKVKTANVIQVMKDLGLPSSRVWYGHDAKEEGVEGVCPEGTKRSDGELGCSLSHLAIWKDILKKRPSSNDWFLILEDDTTLALPRQEFLSMMAKGLERSDREGYEVIHFGGSPSLADLPRGKRLDRHRWRITPGGTFGYGVKASLLPSLVTTLKDSMCKLPVDIIIQKKFKNYGVLVARRPYKPWAPWAQFHGNDTGIFGEKRDDGDFKSDITK